MAEISMLGMLTGNRILMRGRLAPLKRDILFFDRIAIIDPQSVFDAAGSASNFVEIHRQIANETEFILESEYFLSRTHNFHKTKELVDEVTCHQYGNMKFYVDRVMDHDFRTVSGEKLTRQEIDDIFIYEDAMVARYEAVLERASGGVAAIATEIPSWWGLSANNGVEPGHIINLIIKEVPIPSDTTPWQDIFALKADKDLADRARKLRLWATEMARPGINAMLAQEYIADMLADYERYLRAHKLKFISGSLSSTVAGSTEILEEIAKFQASKLVRRFLGIRAFEGEMLMAEAQAPGRQLSIVTALRAKLQ